MTRHVALDSAEHRELRIDQRRGAASAGEPMSAPTFPAEFRSVQAHYPVVFAKDAAGTIRPIALFGLRDGENLFVEDGRWDATYLPLAVERMPFLIGGRGDAPDVHLDLDDPRVVRDGGERLFDATGRATPYLERIASVLRALHEGLATAPAFVDALLQHRLLEPFVLDVALDGGIQHRLAGFYTVHEERLRALPADAVAALHQAGHLEPAYMALASLAQLRALIERMQARARAR